MASGGLEQALTWGLGRGAGAGVGVRAAVLARLHQGAPTFPSMREAGSAGLEEWWRRRGGCRGSAWWKTEMSRGRMAGIRVWGRARGLMS